MTTRRIFLSQVLGTSITLSAGACSPAMTNAPPSNDPPVQVDLNKWASGMYADLYANKSVVVDGYYSPPDIVSAPLSQGSRSIVFAIMSSNPYDVPKPPTTQAELMAYMQRTAAQAQQSMSSAAVSAPISMRDQIFNLRPGQAIRVKGYAYKEGYRSALAPQVLTAVALVIRAQMIEPR